MALRSPNSRIYILLSVYKFHVKDQSGAWRNAAASIVAVCQIRGDLQLARAANFHGGHSFIPTGDDATCTQGESEGLAAIERTIELGAVF